MSAIPIVILAYYVGLTSFLFDHVWVVVPIAVFVWLLLFLPWPRVHAYRLARSAPKPTVATVDHPVVPAPVLGTKDLAFGSLRRYSAPQPVAKDNSHNAFTVAACQTRAPNGESTEENDYARIGVSRSRKEVVGRSRRP